MNKSQILQQKKDELKRQEQTTQSMAPPEFGLMADPLQAKMGGETIESSESTTAESLPGNVQQQMEASMGADFSNVEVHANSGKAESIGAKAYAQGNQVHFAGGQYDPSSKSGQELIGHELAHVKQQQEGRVNATGSVGGHALNDQSSLEKEADTMGAKAASGEMATDKPKQFKPADGGSVSTAPVQCFKMEDGDIKRYPKFANFVQTQMSKASNDARIAHYLNLFGTNEGETARDIPSDLAWGSGPTIKPRSMSKSANTFTSNKGSEEIRIRRDDIQNMEKEKNAGRENFHEILLESSILNSYTQFLDDQDGKDLWGKEGTMMEKAAYGRDIDNVHTAKDARRARFGEGDFRVTVVGKSASFGQRLKIWNAESGNGQHIAEPGKCMTVRGNKFPRWTMQIEHNKAGNDAVKGWTKSNQIVTQECEDKWLVRSEDWTDHDNNDLQVMIEKI